MIMGATNNSHYGHDEPNKILRFRSPVYSDHQCITSFKILRNSGLFFKFYS